MIKVLVIATLTPLLSTVNAADITLKPGMKIEQASALIGRPPDSTTQVGACGIMEVLNWYGNNEQRSLRLIVTDGVISAIVKPVKPEASAKPATPYR